MGWEKRERERQEAEERREQLAEAVEVDGANGMPELVAGVEQGTDGAAGPKRTSGGNRAKASKATPEVRYYTGEEIADVFRVHVKTVERWRRRLGLPCLRLGGTVRYEISDVRDWASARKEG